MGVLEETGECEEEDLWGFVGEMLGSCAGGYDEGGVEGVVGVGGVLEEEEEDL